MSYGAPLCPPLPGSQAPGHAMHYFEAPAQTPVSIYKEGTVLTLPTMFIEKYDQYDSESLIAFSYNYV